MEKCNNRGCFYRHLEIFHWSSHHVVTTDDLFMAVLRLLVASDETFPNSSIPKLAVKQNKLRITEEQIDDTSWMPHMSHFCGRNRTPSEEVSYCVCFFQGLECWEWFLNMSISAGRCSIKRSLFLGLAPRNPQGASSTHYPKCVTAIAEEVTALGLAPRGGGSWGELVCTEYCCCFVPGQSSIFGSDTTTKAVSVLISHMYIIPFPCNFQCPFCLVFVNNILHKYRFSYDTWWQKSSHFSCLLPALWIIPLCNKQRK